MSSKSINTKHEGYVVKTKMRTPRQAGRKAARRTQLKKAPRSNKATIRSLDQNGRVELEQHFTQLCGQRHLQCFLDGE